MFAVLRRLRRRARVGAEPVAEPVIQPAIVRIARVPANDTRPVSSEEPNPVASESDEETIERQITSLLAAWDMTSLCARREFLTRIDQRIMTTHWIRTARGQLAKGAAAVSVPVPPGCRDHI
jgi:hypothetical protein